MTAPLWQRSIVESFCSLHGRSSLPTGMAANMAAIHCSDEETRFLVSIINALDAGRELPSSDIQLYTLFLRASMSRHLDLRHAKLLRESLRLLKGATGQ